MYIVTICCPASDVISFGINHNFLIKPFFYITRKWGEKELLTWNKKDSSLSLKGFQLSEIVRTASGLLKKRLTEKIVHSKLNFFKDAFIRILNAANMRIR